MKKISRFYNEEVKQKFLTHMEEEAYQLSPLRAVFHKSYSMEERLKRDLSFFQKEELVELFNQNKWFLKNTFRTKRTIIRNYAMWCYENGYLTEADSLHGIEELKLTDLTNKNLYEKYMFRDAEELLKTMTSYERYAEDEDLTGQLVMPFAYVCLAYLGLTKEEIIHMKRQDFDEEEGILRIAYQDAKGEEVKREISILNKGIKAYLETAKKQEGIQRYNQDSKSKKRMEVFVAYKDSEYFLRGIKLNGKPTIYFLDNLLSKLIKISEKNSGLKQFQYNYVYLSGLYAEVHGNLNVFQAELNSGNIEKIDVLMGGRLLNQCAKDMYYSKITDFQNWKGYFY